MAEFLVALAGFDRRRGWEPLGHASLFAFLVVELGLSTSSTYWRKSAAELRQDYPELERHLREGRLCLTTMAELAKVLTDENKESVLPRVLGISSREAKEIVAELQPREAPPMRTVVRPLVPALLRAVPAPLAFTLPVAPASPGAATPSGCAAANTYGESLRARNEDDPPRAGRGSPGRDRSAHRRPEPAQRHRQPQVPAEAQDRPVRPLPRHPRCDAGASARGRAGPAPREAVQGARAGEAAADHACVAAAPAAARAPPDGAIAVQATTGLPAHHGAVSTSPHQLELDHVVPWAEWGPSTVENLRVVCSRPEVSPRSVKDWGGRSIA
jgi:hypothetical protein